MIAGLDASNLNGSLDWPALAREHSLSFAFFKATEGRGFRDPLFPAAWQAIKALGLVRGAYHFAHPMTDAQAQADAFLAYVGAAGLEDGDLLALDLEVDDGRPQPAVAAWAQEFCSAVHAGSGRRPLVYTFLSFAAAGNCAGLGGYPLWIADPSSTPGRPRVPAPWTGWSVHQYGQQGLDLDMANYPDAAAMTVALGVPVKPPPVPPWQEAMMNALPTLGPGAADKPGEVFFVHRMQALVQIVGEIKGIASAACQDTTGVFDTATVTALKAVQGSFGLTQDAICGPKTWAALVTGQHG